MLTPFWYAPIWGPGLPRLKKIKQNPGFFGIKMFDFDSEKYRILLDFFQSGQPGPSMRAYQNPPNKKTRLDSNKVMHDCATYSTSVQASSIIENWKKHTNQLFRAIAAEESDRGGPWPRFAFAGR